jgi:hypothetical protein
VDSWRARWNSTANSLPPTLEFRNRGKTTVVYDTRGNAPRELDFGPLGLRVLKALRTPRRAEDVASEFADVSRSDIDAAILGLDAAEVLYSEGSRFLSLVLPSEGVGGSRSDDSAIDADLALNAELEG